MDSLTRRRWSHQGSSSIGASWWPLLSTRQTGPRGAHQPAACPTMSSNSSITNLLSSGTSLVRILRRWTRLEDGMRNPALTTKMFDHEENETTTRPKGKTKGWQLKSARVWHCVYPMVPVIDWLPQTLKDIPSARPCCCDLTQDVPMKTTFWPLDWFFIFFTSTKPNFNMRYPSLNILTILFHSKIPCIEAIKTLIVVERGPKEVEPPND